MKLKELKQTIAGFPPHFDDMEIVLQIDQEGNGYRTVQGAEIGIASNLEDWIVAVHHPGYTAEQCGLSAEEWEKLKQTNKVIVIFP